MQACADRGAHLVEFGVPFSDPLADGPVINAAGTRVLASGATMIALAERVPLVLMCYANLVFAGGVERFVDELAIAGVSGLIIPDLPLEESPAALAACDAAGIALVPLVAPTTLRGAAGADRRPGPRLLYTVSVTGTTGERAKLDPCALLARVHVNAHAAVPVALGFGIATPEPAAAAAGADGVIVGSRLVRAAADGEDVRALVAELSAARRGAAYQNPGWHASRSRHRRRA